MNRHPAATIPALCAGAAEIPTEKGLLRPERALVYNDNRLLLHHAAADYSGSCISIAELAGYTKTAQRALAWINHFPWATITPLAWPRPELLLLTTGDDLLAELLTREQDLLVQAETLERHTLEDHSYLRFQRC